MTRSEPLKVGDAVAIVSPAAALCDHTLVDGAVEVLRSWGLEVILAPHCLGRRGYYSGCAGERIADITSMLADERVKALFCSYGGYGCIHIVDEFASAIERNPKWVVGMSDCSVLHAACVSRSVVSLHSPQCRHMALHPASEPVKMLHNLLFGGSMQYDIPVHPLNICGMAQGRLVGGNLSVLCSLMRTPYDIFVPDTLLFIEDVNEPQYRIERMLYNLKLAGVLQSLAGLVVGQFSGTRDNTHFDGTLYEMIHNVVADCDIPVCFNFPVGHCERNFPLLHGVQACLSVGDKGCVLSEVAPR